MSGKCPQCGESLADQTILTDGSIKCPQCGHGTGDPEAIETLWAGAITTNARPDVTLKLDVEDAGSTASTISDRINVRPQTVSQPDAQVEPPPHYELLQQLGEGGMGIVYRAKQTSADRTIALKLIKEQYQADRRHRNGFLSEAVATANLDHPNIVPVYDVGSREDGTVFYAMKEVRGTEWKAVIKDKTQAENLDIFMRVADAVAFAHSKGVIHRDLKPENVMLGNFGEVLVMDWGLAVAVTDDGKADKLGSQHAVGGTPAYMAPEMAKGEVDQIGIASDIYLLGAILFEIVTGKRPHAGKDALGCLVNAGENRIVDTDATGELLDIAMKAMATEPADRHADARALQVAVTAYRGHEESVLLATRAEENLNKAELSGQYEDYAQAVFGFREACGLWSDNHRAIEGLSRAILLYATVASDKGDLDLATSLLDIDDPAHANLAKKVATLQASRKSRMEHLKVFETTPIAKGGMGEILDARDVNLRRRVAMKVLLDPEKRTKAQVEQFLAEAQVTAQLEHPGIVPLYEMGINSDGRAFYTMKFCTGRTLMAILADIRQGKRRVIKAYPLQRLLVVFQKICDAISYAHSKRVVHRDLKPANIVIGEFGEVQVVDWGLAKVFKKGTTKDDEDPGLAAAPSAWVDSLHNDRDKAMGDTADGAIMGTPSYMAPEQATGKIEWIDQRTDVYALGGILYCILTLVPPLQGDDIKAVLARVGAGDIEPPYALNTKRSLDARSLPHCPNDLIPKPLSDIAMKALARSRSRRFQTVKKLQEAVEAFQFGT